MPVYPPFNFVEAGGIIKIQPQAWYRSFQDVWNNSGHTWWCDSEYRYIWQKTCSNLVILQVSEIPNFNLCLTWWVETAHYPEAITYIMLRNVALKVLTGTQIMIPVVIYSWKWVFYHPASDVEPQFGKHMTSRHNHHHHRVRLSGLPLSSYGHFTKYLQNVGRFVSAPVCYYKMNSINVYSRSPLASSH